MCGLQCFRDDVRGGRFSYVFLGTFGTLWRSSSNRFLSVSEILVPPKVQG